MQVLVGARLFDGETFRDDAALVVDGARILAVTSYADRPLGRATRDLGGGLLAPGFVDVQVNGGGGALLNEDPSPKTILRIAEAYRPYGSVGLMPTLVTDAPAKMRDAISATREARKLSSAVLGLHLEGPFLDVQRKGAHEPRFIREITPEDIERIGGADCGAMMLTLAPNRVPTAIVKELASRGALVSLGHAEASFAEASAALAAGARAFTHLFNAMSQLVGREPGMAGAALVDQESFVGVIADGHHVHPAALKIAFAAKRRDRFMLITDAMSPAAGGPDSFTLQGRTVVKADGCLRLEDGTIAGSCLTMDEAVRYVVENGLLPLADALVMASRTPATFLRLDRELGRLAPGYRASFVHLDEGLRVRETWIDGRL